VFRGRPKDLHYVKTEKEKKKKSKGRDVATVQLFGPRNFFPIFLPTPN